MKLTRSNTNVATPDFLSRRLSAAGLATKRPQVETTTNLLDITTQSSVHPTPISIVPVEVLSKIFLIAHDAEVLQYERDCTGTDWYYVTTPIRLSSVCRFWRAVAHDTSRLWSFLQIGPWKEFLLADMWKHHKYVAFLSRPNRLEIKLQEPEGGLGRHLDLLTTRESRHISKHQARINDFIQLNNGRPFTLAIEETQTNKSRSSRYRNHDRKPEWMESFLDLIPLNQVHRLLLRTWRLAVGHPASQFLNCRTLRILAAPRPHHYTRVSVNFSNFPTLQSLSMVHCLPHTPPTYPVQNVEFSCEAFPFHIGIVINLSRYEHMRSLHLKKYSHAYSLGGAPFVPSNIPGLNLPKLEEVLLEGATDSVFQYFARCTFPSLTRLFLHNLPYFNAQDFCLAFGDMLSLLEIRNPPAMMRSDWMSLFEILNRTTEFRVYCDGTAWSNQSLLQALDKALLQPETGGMPSLTALRLYVGDVTWRDTLQARVDERNSRQCDGRSVPYLVLC